MHPKEQVIRVIDQRYEAEPEIELASGVVQGVHLDSADADVLGYVLRPA